MRLVEGKHGEKIGLFEYWGMITSFDYNSNIFKIDQTEHKAYKNPKSYPERI